MTEMRQPLQSNEVLHTHLVTSGCPDVIVHSDGHQYVLEGSVPTLECKLSAEEAVRSLTGLPVLNRIRVVPSEF